MSSRVSRPPPPAVASRSESTQPFKALLDEVRRTSPNPPGLKKKPNTTPPAIAPVKADTSRVPTQKIARATVVAAQAQASAQTTVQARARVESEAQRLESVRAHHVTTAESSTTVRAESTESAEQKTNARVVDLIVKELVAEFETRPGGAASQKVGNPLQPISSLNELPFALPAPQPRPTPEVRAAQAAALIERIDTFVRSQRPALALTLNNSLGARVEIEKLGPGRIALKLVGQNGPPDADTVNRIRDELEARGLKVGALSVG
ncbi:MAG: hypothetical protein JNM69_19465 [Archangium sp.]|nr:hypothetical protein [Archangium sp.]